MMVTVLRIAAVLLVIWLFLRFLKSRVTIWIKGPSGKGGEVAEMVKDPVCGSYVSVESSETKVKDGKEYHFCSRECADRF